MGERKRDRSGEIYQNDLTENEGVRRPDIEQAQHDLHLDPNVDSQEDDRKNPEFAKELRSHHVEHRS